jgi:transcriptional regulator with XRE-family HTH domain
MKKGKGIIPPLENHSDPEGMEIKIVRIRAGLRQYELAKSVGIPPSRLCEIEAGRRRASAELLEHIFRVIKESRNDQ